MLRQEKCSRSRTLRERAGGRSKSTSHISPRFGVFFAFDIETILPERIEIRQVRVLPTLLVGARLSGEWQRETQLPHQPEQPLNGWQAGKGGAVLAALVLAFLVSNVPREVVALAAAGIVLTSRRMASREMLNLVDWQLLVPFASLFVVNHAMQQSENLSCVLQVFRSAGIAPDKPVSLFISSVILSNLVSNVPATMLLLPSATHPLAGPILALSSTLAGNLLIVGSIANIIVVDQASRLGLTITWRDHARVGIPVTMITLLTAAGWLWIVAQWQRP